MAIYQPSNVIPSSFAGAGLGVVDVNNNILISWQVNGNSPMTAFRIQIYNNASSNESLVKETEIISLSNPFYGTDNKGNPQQFSTSEYIKDTTWANWGLSNGNEYKMVITQYWGSGRSNSIEQWSGSVFITQETPSVSIAFSPELNAEGQGAFANQGFTASVTPESTLINSVRWQFGSIDGVPADGTVIEDSLVTILDDTGAINTSVLEYAYDGLFSGNTYAIKCAVETHDGLTVSTGWQAFEVNYVEAKTSAENEIAVECLADDSVLLSWAKAKNIQGEISPSGTQPTVKDGLLLLNENETVTWDKIDDEAMNIEPPYTVAWKGELCNWDVAIIPVELKPTITERTITIPADSTLSTDIFVGGVTTKEYALKNSAISGKTFESFFRFKNHCYCIYEGMSDQFRTGYFKTPLYVNKDGDEVLSDTLEEYGTTYTSYNSCVGSEYLLITYRYSTGIGTAYVKWRNCYRMYNGNEWTDEFLISEFAETDKASQWKATKSIIYSDGVFYLVVKYVEMIRIICISEESTAMKSLLDIDTDSYAFFCHEKDNVFWLYTKTETIKLKLNPNGESKIIDSYNSPPPNTENSKIEYFTELGLFFSYGGSNTNEKTFYSVNGYEWIDTQYRLFFLAYDEIRRVLTATLYGGAFDRLGYSYDGINWENIEGTNYFDSKAGGSRSFLSTGELCGFSARHSALYEFHTLPIGFKTIKKVPISGWLMDYLQESYMDFGQPTASTQNNVNDSVDFTFSTYTRTFPETILSLTEKSAMSTGIATITVDGFIGGANLSSISGGSSNSETSFTEHDITVKIEYETPSRDFESLDVVAYVDYLFTQNKVEYPKTLFEAGGFSIDIVKASIHGFDYYTKDWLAIQFENTKTGSWSRYNIRNSKRVAGMISAILELATDATQVIFIDASGYADSRGGFVLKVDEPITSLKLTGKQACDWLYIGNGYIDIDGAFSPKWTEDTLFLADFSSERDALQAGTFASGGSIVNALYRIDEGDNALKPIYSAPTNINRLKDYGLRSGKSYAWELFYLDGDNVYSTPIKSSEVCKQLKVYSLIEASQDKDFPNVYHVVKVWRFGNNLSVGGISNNNTPNWLTNFTPYRLRQPSSRLGQSGTLQALLSNYNRSENFYKDTVEMMDELKQASASLNTFFLKDMKGNLYMVGISGPITQTVSLKSKIQEVTISVPWEEVGDATNVSLIQLPTDEGWLKDQVFEMKFNANAETGILSAEYPENYVGTTFEINDNEELTANTPLYVAEASFELENGQVIAEVKTES